MAPGNARVGFAALVHDLGKALTPADELPRHVAHEHTGLALVAAVCDRYKVPTDFRQLALMACREHLNVHRLDELRPETVHDLLQRCDGFRQPQRIAELALVCEADKRGRAGAQDAQYPQAATLLRLHAAACAVSARDLDLAGSSGPEVGELLRQARIAAIRQAR